MRGMHNSVGYFLEQDVLVQCGDKLDDHLVEAILCRPKVAQTMAVDLAMKNPNVLLHADLLGKEKKPDRNVLCTMYEAIKENKDAISKLQEAVQKNIHPDAVKE